MDDNLRQEAVKYMRKAKDELVAKFADLKSHPEVQSPVSVFMAGSPGAGKTEFSKNLIKELGEGVVRIDPDEIRSVLPQYTGGNASLFQSAIKIGVDHLFYFALANNQNFVLDGTLANFEMAQLNTQRCLERRNFVEVFYLFQDPLVAWKFTEKREVLEGRNITKEAFVRAFISSKENVNYLKDVFKDKVRMNLIIKDYNNDVGKTKLDIDNVDSHLDIFYTKDELEKLLL